MKGMGAPRKGGMRSLGEGETGWDPRIGCRQHVG